MRCKIIIVEQNPKKSENLGNLGQTHVVSDTPVVKAPIILVFIDVEHFARVIDMIGVDY